MSKVEFNPPHEEVKVNRGFFFKSQAVLKKIPHQSQLSKNTRPEIVGCYYSHGSCMCGKDDIDTIVIKMNVPIKYKFYNGKEIESNVFVLGNECIITFKSVVENTKVTDGISREDKQ